MRVRYVIALAALVVGGAVLRLPQTGYGLPAARFPDSVKTVDAAWSLAQAWRSGEFAIDPGTYQYPTLYLNAMAAVFAVAGRALPPEQVGRLIAALAAALTAIPLYLLGLYLFDRRTGFAAAALGAFGFLFVLQGRHPTPDALQTLLLIAGFAALFRPAGRPGSRWLIAGFFIGLAAGAKYTAVLFAAPAAAVILVVAAVRREARAFRHAALGAAGAAVGFVVASPAFLIRPGAFLSRLLLESRIQASGDLAVREPGFWDYLFGSFSVAPDLPYAVSLHGTLGLGFIAASAFGLFLALRETRGSARVQAAALALAVVFGYVYFSEFSRIRGLRFVLPVAALLTVLAGRGIAGASDAMAARFQQRPALGRPAAWTAVLLALALAPSVTLSARYLRALREPDSRLSAAVWILGHVPAGSRILNLMHGPALPANQYDAVHVRFPEYRFELAGDHRSAPTLAELDRAKIDCVIWNDFYLSDLEARAPDPAVEAYRRGWRDFRDEIRERADPALTAEIPGTVSPMIRVLCRRDRASWTQPAPGNRRGR